MRRSKRYFQEKPDNKDKACINNYIKAKQVRLIDETGENVGVVPIKEATNRAKTVELDLVQVSDSNPPVCKIMDHGKYLYEKSKKSKLNQKGPKNEDKEIRLRPSTGQHDLEIKAKKAKEFLDEGRKVNISFKLRGRERANLEVVDEVVDKFYEILKESAKLEKRGNAYVLIPT